MPSSIPANEDTADMIHITSNGTGILLKREAAVRQNATAHEILCLAAMCFLFGFAFYIGLMFRSGGW